MNASGDSLSAKESFQVLWNTLRLNVKLESAFVSREIKYACDILFDCVRMSYVYDGCGLLCVSYRPLLRET